MSKKKKQNNKKIIIIVIAIISLIVLFLGYRLFMYYRYTTGKPDNADEVANGFKNPNTINITKKVLSESEYITQNNIKIKNIFDGYNYDENNNAGYAVYRKETDGHNYTIQFGSTDNSIKMVDAFVDDSIVIYGDENGFLKGDIIDADRKDFLEKNNIKNDIDFYKFVGENYFIESNIFTDIKTLKQNYAFNIFTSIAIPKISGWTIISGDLEGYVFYIGTKDDVSVYSITIIDNSNLYGILTNDPRFKDETFLIDLISTIEIVN